jgi:sugar phosphate isomerase/epimerase
MSTPDATFAEDVAAYAAAGFDAIGIWEFKLPDDDEANIALLDAAGLAVANCVPGIPSILPIDMPDLGGESDPSERIAAMCASVRRFGAYSPECVICLTGPRGDRSPDDARSIVVDGLRQVAATAREARVRIAFEPIHPSQRDTVSYVNTVADAAALLDGAGLPDVGLMLDSFNLWDDEGAVEWLRAHGHRVAGFHVADMPGEGRTDRLLPGEAGSRTRELVDAARAGGWSGSLDVEIFSTADAFWGLPLSEAAGRAHAAAAALLA